MVEKQFRESLSNSFLKCQTKLEVTCIPLQSFSPSGGSALTKNDVPPLEEGLSAKVLIIPIQVSLCQSTLFIEKSFIEFDSCAVNQSVSQDIQVWNRSECDLYFKVQLKSLLPALSHHNSFTFLNTDFNSVIRGQDTCYVSSFSSVRIRVTFTAKVQHIYGDFK